VIEVNAELVKRVAHLANLRLGDEEISHYQTQLTKILGYVAELGQVEDKLGKDWRSDTKGGATPERRDEVKPGAITEEIMVLAPQKIGTAFQVPRIIE